MEIRIKLSLEDDVITFFRQRFETIEQLLNVITHKETQIMSQLDDLNKAISDEDVEVQDILASVTKIDADVDALLAKIASGGTSLPDITTQLTAIAAHTSALTTASQQLKAQDTKANA
jgi:predicted  nucleic acid-binding Zn-ribbon protein